MNTKRSGAEMTTEERQERLWRKERNLLAVTMVPVVAIAFALGWCLMDALRMALGR